jgi:hypothetical protein
MAAKGMEETAKKQNEREQPANAASPKPKKQPKTSPNQNRPPIDLPYYLCQKTTTKSSQQPKTYINTP